MQLFINYAHADKAEVGELLDILKSASHDVWLDKQLPEVQDWRPTMLELLGKSDVFIHIISDNSNSSEWSQWLLSQAIKQGKPIVPVLLLPVTDFPPLFKDKPYSDFTNGVKPELVAMLVSSLYNPLKFTPDQAPEAPEIPAGKPAHAMRESMIFISYSRKDMDYAYQLEAYLEEKGFSIWIDKGNISYGDQWVRQIKTAIETCAAYLVIMTPDAENSEWVQRELRYAEECKKPIFPLLLLDKIWFQLGTIHVCDVTGNKMPPDSFLARLAEVAPREEHREEKNLQSMITGTTPAVVVQKQIFLSYFEDDPLVKPYAEALETLLAAEFSTSWKMIRRRDFGDNPAAETCDAAIASSHLYVSLLGVFYGKLVADMGYVECESKSARHLKKDQLNFVINGELPAGLTIDFLAEYGADVKRQVSLRNAVENPIAISAVTELEEHIRKYIVEYAAREAAVHEPAKPFFSPEDQSHLSYDRRSIEAYDAGDLDQELIKKFLERPLAKEAIQRAKVESESLEKQLQALGLTQEDGKITIGTFFCFAPLTLLVNKYSACALQMVIYDDVKRASAKADINVVNDNLLKLWDEGLEFLFHRSGLGRKGNVGKSDRDEFEIPEIALREALANALVHRDYESPMLRDQPTLLEVYPDRVEITSFGKLPEGITPEQLNTKPETLNSVRRNPLVASIFQYMSYMELNGSGISRMQEAVRNAGLSLPEITEDEDRSTVKVILQRPVKQKKRASSVTRKKTTKSE